MTFSARQTYYNGRLYRSEIEAKVFCLLDWLGIPVIYEPGAVPTPLGDWRPDGRAFGKSPLFVEAKWECTPESEEGNWPRIRSWVRDGNELAIISLAAFDREVWHVMMPTNTGPTGFECIELLLAALLLYPPRSPVESPYANAVLDSALQAAIGICSEAVAQIANHEWYRPGAQQSPMPTPDRAHLARIECCVFAALHAAEADLEEMRVIHCKQLRTAEQHSLLEQHELDRLLLFSACASLTELPPSLRESAAREADALLKIGFGPLSRDVSLRLVKPPSGLKH